MVALASQGGVAIASSATTGYAATGAIDGDETGKLWGSNGGWNDNTLDVAPAAGTVQEVDTTGGYHQTTYSNQFAKVVRTANNNPKPTSTPLPGYSFMLEKTDVSYTGHSFSAGTYITSNGVEYWDSSGDRASSIII